MKPIATTFILASLLCTPLGLLHAQSPSPGGSPKAAATAPVSPTAAAPAGGFTDVYHVHFAKAAAGKAATMAEAVKKPDPQAPMPGHMMVLRHQSGEAWDFAAVEHFGTKVVVEASRPPVPPEERNLGDWHNDTYASGPAWSQFAKEMGLDGDGKASAASVYVVSTYRALTGQREALQKFLSEPPERPGDTSAGTVLLQHMEGAVWNFMVITRYNSWEDFAKNESNSIANTAKNQSAGWFKLRELIASHGDTVTVRIAP